MVLWLVIDGSRRAWSRANSSDLLLAALRAEARERGLPMQVAAGDEGEVAAVPPTAADADAIAALIARIEPLCTQIALVGHVAGAAGGGGRVTPGPVSAQWH